MADLPYHVVVSPIVQAMLHKLVSPLLREFSSEWDVEEELGELGRTLEKLKPMVDFAELNQRKEELLRISLRDLRDEVYYADDALEEFMYEAQKQRVEDETNQSRSRRQVHPSFSFSLNKDQMLRRNEIAPLVTEITEKFVSIKKEIERHYFGGPDEKKLRDMQSRLPSFSLRSTRQETGSSIDDSDVFGRSGVVNDIINLLSFEEFNQRGVSVIAIVGLGGIGKTTLAQRVYNHPTVEQHFDVRSWVCVSEDFNVMRLTGAILESATEKPVTFKELPPVQNELEKTLRGKKFLLVLDDVWNEDRNTWEKLRVPFRVANKGSIIIVTTRSQRVSATMGAMKKIDLNVLSEEDSWLLFKKLAFNDNDSDAHRNLEPIGKKIVKQCKGLPLAVKALGGLLKDNKDEDEWEYILDSGMWDLEGVDVLPALSLSYHHLPSHLQLCFAYCSLFPKDYRFEKKTLVRYWMAEGFVLPKQAERMEDMGGTYFDVLFHRSFFQKFGGQETQTFVMHDLIHDLAQLVSSGMRFRIESGKSCDIYEKARRLSFNDSEVNLVSKELYKCRRLSTFLNFQPFGSISYGSTVPDDLFDALRCLRVLDLKYSGLERLSESIGNLKHLRYLDLSKTRISVLPEQVCNLYNLQTLILKDCSIRELPKNMGYLISLERLITDIVNWSELQRGIGRLTCLRMLPCFSVGQEDGFKIKELKELRHLDGRLRLSKLENVVNAIEAKEANMKNKQKLDELELWWSHKIRHLRDGGDAVDADEAVLEGLQPNTGLKSLTIRGYCGLRFPSWMMTDLSCYNKLVSLKLYSCGNCKILPPLGQLCFLVTLELLKLDGVEYWSRAEEGEFPCLQYLTMIECPKLKTLPQLLPAVNKLKISNCGSLTMLPRLPSISTLVLQNCDERILSWVHQCTSIQSLDIYVFQDATCLPAAMLQPLTALQTLRIHGLNNLVSLSEDVGLQHLAYLRDLEFGSCPRLMSLPNELRSLSFLQKLQISSCPNLTSMLEVGLPTNLQTLSIANCPKLESRCREGGEDWRRIAHIPKLVNYGILMEFLKRVRVCSRMNDLGEGKSSEKLENVDWEDYFTHDGEWPS